MPIPSSRGLVECSTCGFLAKRPKQTTYLTRRPPGVFEVGVDERGSPGMGLFAILTKGESPTALELCCSRGVDITREIETEAVSRGLDQDPAVAALHVLSRARDCSKWGEYEPGLDPAGHFAEMKFAELEQSRKDFQLQMEQDRKDRDRSLRWITAVAVVVALLVGFMQMTPQSVLYQAAVRVFRGAQAPSPPSPPAPIEE